MKISAGALLTLSALLIFCEWDMLAALLLSCAAHELGHLMALWLLGARITGFRASAAGFVILTSGASSTAGEVLALASGPVAGAAFAAAASVLGSRINSGVLLCAGGVSALLTVFNLLPALPLDGGRIIEALAGRRTAEGLGAVVSICCMGLGLLLAYEGGGWGLLAAGAVLTLCQTRL